MATRLTAIVVLLAAIAFGVDRLVSTAGSGPPSRTHIVTAQRSRGRSPSPLTLQQQLEQQVARLLPLLPERPLNRTPPRLPLFHAPRARSCFTSGCSLKPCVYEAYLETVATAAAAATVLLPNGPPPPCVHPPPIRISAP